MRAGGLEAEFERVDTREAFEGGLAGNVYDLILSDFSLPSFDGLSALGIARERCPDVPFIFVSGVLGEEVAVDTLQKGATDYVLKQRLTRLVPAMNRALAERGSVRRGAGRRRGCGSRRRRRGPGFWQMDVETGAMEVSAAYKENFGLPVDGPADREGLIAMVHPDDRERVRRTYEGALATRTDYAAEYRVVWPDGSVHWVSARGRGVYCAERDAAAGGGGVDRRDGAEAGGAGAEGREGSGGGGEPGEGPVPGGAVARAADAADAGADGGACWSWSRRLPAAARGDAR